MIRYLILISLFFITTYSQAKSGDECFEKVELKTDTLAFSWMSSKKSGEKEELLTFMATRNNPVCSITVWPSETFDAINLLPSNDFNIIDSLINFGNYYRFKIQFRDIINSEFMNLTFQVIKNGNPSVYSIPLLPYLQMDARLTVKDNELFIGEEKIFEISTNDPDNIKANNEWQSNNAADYKISRNNSTLLVHIIPNQLGKIDISIPITVRKPVLNDKQKLTYSLPEIRQQFMVKSSRLQFLSIDQKEITLDEDTKLNGIEVQIEDNRLIQLSKTYRVENQEEPGGALMAELFTKRRMGNNKILCLLRPYNYHNTSQGYLYLKDGDEARFISNFNISHATIIDKISILQEGSDWRESNRVFPGQTIDIMLEGKGFSKANFHFEDISDVTADTITRSETMIRYKIKIPVNIAKRSINIYNYNKPTGKTLVINEFQEPRDLDYVLVDYGEFGRKISEIRGPILYDKTVKDVILTFHNQNIDDEKIHGKQYINLDVRITNKKGELVEMRTIENVVVCPNDQSPRYQYYQKNDCMAGDLSLNKYLSRKTYDLDEWSKISLTIKNDKTKYGGQGFQRDVDIYLKRKYAFDVEVSFPAGLVTISKQADGNMGFGSLSSISMAIIAQFSFYHPDKIARYRPYKFGAGFLAYNAFNFSDQEDDRDVGIVALGSLYPTTRDTKLSFPLYVGGGYFLKSDKWFFLIGPGIRVKL